MSGASGAVPAAIHATPECLNGGPLAQVRDGDIIRLDSYTGKLEAKVSEEVWRSRVTTHPGLGHNQQGMGRDLFGGMRALATDAEAGAMTFGGST
jgi:phosphogluconate dehydratase